MLVTFKAATDLTGSSRAVTLSEGGVHLSNAGETPVGLLLPEHELTLKGDTCLVQTSGAGLWRTGEGVIQGEFLSPAEDGLAFKTRPEEYLFARALISAKSGAIPVQIVNAGFFDLPIFEEEYDVVKIFFDFPISRHRRWRAISWKNPRADLTREEIKQAGQFAVDNELIMNAQGETATRVSLAALKSHNSERIF